MAAAILYRLCLWTVCPVSHARTLSGTVPGSDGSAVLNELGKNVVPIKVWIPARMKNDLQILADHAGLPLSQLAREIVISRLLGHGTLPARPILTHAEPTTAEDWCQDLEVPWREVDEGEYRHAREGDTRWHYEEAPDDEESAAI